MKRLKTPKPLKGGLPKHSPCFSDMLIKIRIAEVLSREPMLIRFPSLEGRI